MGEIGLWVGAPTSEAFIPPLRRGHLLAKRYRRRARACRGRDL